MGSGLDFARPVWVLHQPGEPVGPYSGIRMLPSAGCTRYVGRYGPGRRGPGDPRDSAGYVVGPGFRGLPDHVVLARVRLLYPFARPPGPDGELVAPDSRSDHRDRV